MATYFFHTDDSGYTTIDETGLEFDTLEEVKAEAMQAAGEAIKDFSANAWGGYWRMMVTGETGKMELVMSFIADPLRPPRFEDISRLQ